MKTDAEHITRDKHLTITPTTVLDLGGALPFASGTYRDVYHYPGREEAVVKVLKPGAAYRPNRPIRNFLKARSTPQLYRFMFREYEAYLEARLANTNKHSPLPICHLLWLQQTSRGLGMVAERIRGGGDKPARSLTALIAEGGLDDELLATLNAFIEQLNTLDIIANDTNPDNVLLDETGPAPRFVLVDGFGDPSPLRLKRLSRRLRQNARNRRYETMAAALGLKWDKERAQIVRV